MNRFKVILSLSLIWVSSLLASVSTPFGDGIEAIIFDCDGVLVDTEYLKFIAWKEALACQEIVLELEEYQKVAGHCSQNVLPMLTAMKGVPIHEEVIALKKERYTALQKQGVAPISEMVAFANYLVQEKERFGIKLGLASSACREEIFHNLEQIGLLEAFDLIISGKDDLKNYTDAEGTNKPKPYIYMEAAKRLGVTAENCLVFEDTQAGVEAASEAGMIVLAVPNRITCNQDFSRAQHIIESHNELSTLITND